MSDFNIKKRKHLSDAEIESFKDFDAFQSKLSSADKGSSMLKWGIGGTVIVGVVLSVVLLNNSSEKAPQSTDIVKTESINDNNISAFNPNDNLKFRDKLSFWDSIEFNQAENGVKWLTKSNTVVILPNDALITEDGEDVTGTVKFKINEFYDGVDAALSGIKMRYDSAGYEYHFKTGGMFELRAYQNNKELKIKPGKKVEVFMSSNIDKGNYNTYYFNNKNDEWEYKEENAKAVREFVYNEEIEEKVIQNEIKSYPIALDFDESEFPELKGFKNVLFYPKKVDEKKYKKLKTTTWEEIDLKKKDGEYLLKAYSRSEDITMVVIPSTEIANQLNDAKKTKQKNNRNNLSEIKYFVGNQSEDDGVFKVSGLNFSPIVKYTPSMQEIVNSKIVRVFSIEEFGMWNCDAPEKLPQGMLANEVIFIDSINDTLDYNGNYYLTENDRQLMYTYFPGTPLSFNPKSENCIWFTHLKDKEVYLYYVNGEDFKLVDDKAFKMKKVKINPDKTEPYEIKRVLGV